MLLSFTKHSPKAFALFWFIGLLLAGLQTKAQVAVSLQYTEENNTTTLPAGLLYTMHLAYSISSTTGNASGVKAVIHLPDTIIDAVNFGGTIHAPTANFVFDNTPGAKKVTINFIDPVPSGSTGVLEVGFVVNNGSITNGTTLITSAELTATGGFTSGVKTHTLTISAAPYICTRKSFVGGGGLNNVTTYAIRVTGNDLTYGFLPYGYLNGTNIKLTDNLPAGTEFVSAQLIDVASGNPVSTTITQNAGVVTAVIPDLIASRSGQYNWATSIYELQINVKYNSSAGFTSGQTVTNTSTLVYTPFGGSPITVTDGSKVSDNACTNDLNESIVLADPTVNATLTKKRNYGVSTDIFPGQTFSYCINFINSGNVELNNVEIIENIPSALRYAGKSFNPSGPIDHFEYQTNLNSTWTIGTLDVAAPGPDPNNPAEYYTRLKVVLTSPLAPNAFLLNYGSSCPNFQFVPATEVTSDTPIQNCVEWTSTTVGIPTNRTVCDGTITLKSRPKEAIVSVQTNHAPACVAPYLVGQVLTNTLTVSTDPGGTGLENPVLMLFPSPAGYFEYVPTSASFNTGTSSLTVTPTFEYIPNYAGTGRFLLRWTFPPGTKLPYGTSMSVTAQVKLTSAGISGHQLEGYVGGSNIGSFNQNNGGYPTSVTDQYDLNGDGSTKDILGTQESSYNSCPITVVSSASMESIKWVKGQFDTDYSHYPASGNTVRGGKADYKLVVRNTGNVPMKNITIVDMLPFIGDKGVIDQSLRNTAWRPNLADSISAPAGVTVYYSTVSNPCRDEMKAASDPSPFPTGCTVANWNTVPPTDITTVQSLKFDFGSIVINGSDSLLLTWPMRAPVDAPVNGEIAWNSFGFVATRTDNNTPLLAAEPTKVGVKLAAPAPAFYGDYVWYDTDHDGIQDAGEQGVDGVKVILFKDNGDNVANPATDTEITFTVTGNGGKYLFPNLQVGDYYAVFFPPTSYSVSPPNQGGDDTVDSDGTITTYQGSLAYITTITHLDTLEEDLTWDLGIYCGIMPTITSNSPVQIGGTVSLSASGGASYSWTGPNGFVSTSQNPTIPNATTASVGTYKVSVNSAEGCYASLLVDVLVQNCTTPNAGADVRICAPATSATVVAAGDGQTWSAQAENPASATVNQAGQITGMTANGTYTFILSAGAGCSDTVQVVRGQMSMVVTPGACQTATNQYALSGTVSLTNTTVGTLTITDGVLSTTVAVTTSTTAVNFSLTGESSGSGNHTVTATLSSCGTTSTAYTAPASCTVAPACGLVMVVTPGLCLSATNSYVLSGTINATNVPVSGTLTISSGAFSTRTLTLPAGNASGTFSYSGLVSNGQAYTITASYSNSACSPVSQTFSAPVSCSVAPPCSISAVATAGICQTATNTYSSTVVVTVKNPTSGTLSITDGTQTLTFSTTANAQNTFTAQFAGLISNGVSHTVTATLAGCSTTTTTYSAPESCSVTPACNLSLTASASTCNPATNLYVLSGAITVTSSPSSQTLTLTDDSYVRSLTVAAGTTTINYSYTTLQSDGAKHTVTVVSSATTCGTAFMTYTAPASCSVAPACSVSATATAGLCATATNTYSNTVLVTMTNPTAGTLTITNGVNSLTFAVPASIGVVTTSAIFNGLISDGASHTVTASLSDCSTITTTYTAPGSCTQLVGNQLALDKLVSKSKAKVGDVLAYTLIVTNLGTTTASNVVVRDSSTRGLAYVTNSATTPTGTTFTQGAPISTWTIGTLTAGQSLSMTFQVIADSSGIMYNVATIPGDTATVCTSVPYIMCAGDTYLFRLTAAPGRSSYKWFKDTIELTGQTTNVLDITAPGAYSLAVDNVTDKCPDFSCCPFIVEEDTLPTFQAAATPVTCTGSTAQTNGRIVLSQFRTVSTYQYSMGSSFNAAASLSGSKQVIPANGLIVSNLANPTVAQAYTVRVYNSSGCYTDVTVMLLPTVCDCPTYVCLPIVIKQTTGVKRK